MKIVVCTSNSLRHKFLANELTKNADDALIIAECKPKQSPEQVEPIKEHFELRDKTEKEFFAGNEYFIGKTYPILWKELKLPPVYETIKQFNPDLIFIFGSSIIKEPLLSFLPEDRYINLHLGLSPYYRGAGTNFWPFVNNELQYLGSSILYLDNGIDTGDIIEHVRPVIESGDNVHTIGCKIIKESAEHLVKLMNTVKEGKQLNRIKQWKVPNEKYYEEKDFNIAALAKYKANLRAGMIDEYVTNPQPKIKLIQ